MQIITRHKSRIPVMSRLYPRLKRKLERINISYEYIENRDYLVVVVNASSGSYGVGLRSWSKL